MARTAVAILIVVGLAAGVWWLWPGESATPGTTLPAAAPTTTATSSTGQTSSSTSSEESHVVETVEEAEVILRALWFGWFEGIYNQDVNRIREVVAPEEQVETAMEQFGVMEFVTAPTAEALVFTETEILRSDAECLAVWSIVNADFRPGSSEGVVVLRFERETWRQVSYWALRDDLWEQDCEAVLSSS